jgi:hypothetical protein
MAPMSLHEKIILVLRLLNPFSKVNLGYRTRFGSGEVFSYQYAIRYRYVTRTVIAPLNLAIARHLAFIL